MLTATGRIILMDFGLTRGITNDILGKTVADGNSGIFGSLEFLSPEQIADEPVSLPSDIFSIGSLTYLLTTGHSAFKHRNPADLLRAILNVDYAPASTLRSDIPGGLERLIEDCLVRDPNLRTTAQAIAHWLGHKRARTVWLATRTERFTNLTPRTQHPKQVKNAVGAPPS